MLEWKLIANLDKNPKIIRLFNHRNSSHPLIREFAAIDLDNIYYGDESLSDLGYA